MADKQKRKEPFWVGGAAACMAVCFTHPLDQTKYRMQVHRTKAPMLTTIHRTATQTGIFSLWTGLSASLLRQATYSTTRFGMHAWLSATALQYSSNKQKLPATLNMVCAGVAGGLAGVVGNPAEMVLVRMCADAALPAPQRFAYAHPLAGLWRIYRDEGVGAFGRGLGANVVRSVLMNVAQIATYASAKQLLMEKAQLSDNLTTHAAASLVAGTVATTVCAPADVLKSRLQSASGNEGLRSVIRSGIREEGVGFLMKGWTPAWLRLTPQTVLMFVFMEQLRRLTTMRYWAPAEEAAKV